MRQGFKALILLVSVFGISIMLGCSSSIKDWDNHYKYSAEKGWSKEKYEKEIMGSKEPPPEQEVNRYEEEKKQKLIEILKSPVAPVKAPDKVLRVLVMPWVDDKGNFHSYSYIFINVEDGEWILGEYLYRKGRRIKLLTPLENQGGKER